MPEENAPDAWIGKRVGIHVGTDIFNGVLLSVDADGVVVRSVLNYQEIVDAIRKGEEPEEPDETLCWFPMRQVRVIMQLDPE